jgi:beta-lactamase superfamily II metal-dependent hydrolase
MTASVAFVDVGQGDCTIALDNDTGSALLIDCREGHHTHAVDELEQLGFTALEAAIVSHTHLDHFGGVLDVLEMLEDRFTGTLYFNQDSLMAVPVAGEERKVTGQKLRALVLRARELGPGRVRRMEAPIAPTDVGTLRWEVLAPTYDEVLAAISEGNPNLASAIVVLRVGADCVVVGGDAQLVTWERIADQIPKGAVVRWPHHGGSLGAQPDADAKLMTILDPSTVIVSVGASNTHGHPTEGFFAAVGGRPGSLLCTQATGACVAGGGSGGTCAGTIRVIAGGSYGVRVETGVDDHGAVVAAFGNGRCTLRSSEN